MSDLSSSGKQKRISHVGTFTKVILHGFFILKGAFITAYKKSRRLRVYNHCGYHYNPTPAITLKGKWLEELNFPSGTPIIVKCEDGMLTITRADEIIIDKATQA